MFTRLKCRAKENTRKRVQKIRHEIRKKNSREERHSTPFKSTPLPCPHPSPCFSHEDEEKVEGTRNKNGKKGKKKRQEGGV